LRGCFRDVDPWDCTVANIKSQIKRNRQNEAARQRNKAVRSELKTRRKSAFATAAAGAEDAADALRQAVKRIDKAASKGIIHKNKAARDKSRLMSRIAGSGD
jgi:small subunit ribosomal protein S20